MEEAGDPHQREGFASVMVSSVFCALGMIGCHLARLDLAYRLQLLCVALLLQFLSLPLS